MKTRINLVLMLALALTLIGAALTTATPAANAPPPGRRAHVTSTPPPATPA